MKRHGHLRHQVVSFEALLRAADNARKSKRFRPAVAAFHFDQERELLKLHEELTTKSYQPGAYRSFFIHQPKKRQISAAPYRDRFLHHALTGVLEPIFEKTFIADSYACRKGKGTHAAVKCCQEFTRHFRYVLKADIQKFFPSLDHEICKELVARKIKDPDVLWLVNKTIDHSRRRSPRRVSASNVIAAAAPSHLKQAVFGAQPQPCGTSPDESSACALRQAAASCGNE